MPSTSPRQPEETHIPPLLENFFADNPWSAYLLAALGPFVQEDLGVFGAASAAATESDPGLLLAVWLGLTVSDGWKYWAGRLAYKIPAAARFADRPSVREASEKVLSRLALKLIITRYIPGTRIPTNVACGLFGIPFPKYLLFNMISGAIYIALAYALLVVLGEVVGEQVREALPFVIIPLVLVAIGLVAWRNRRSRSDHQTALSDRHDR